MAARFWRLLFVCEFTAGAALAALAWTVLPVSAAAALATALVLVLFLPGALVAASFLIASLSVRRKLTIADAGYLLRALLTETVDFNLAVLAMIAPHGTLQRPMGCVRADARARPLLLIHGITCNRRIWRSWLPRLEAAGFGPIRATDLEPVFADIEIHAARVERELRALQQQSNGAPVAIVAHSMGGLVARAALRRVGPGVISQIITIATPHHGTRLARWFHWLPMQQMCPESAWLRALNTARQEDPATPLASIYSLEDNLIVPVRSAVLQHARLFELRGFGHLGLLACPDVIQCTLTALADV
jgi:triacylglycerol esterase/lipase EstA (alpha/beta hydrolase family)